MTSSRSELIAVALVCYQLSGMSCGNCVQKIKDAVGSRTGVSKIEVSLVESSARLHTGKELTAREKKDVLDSFNTLGYPAREVPCPP